MDYKLFGIYRGLCVGRASSDAKGRYRVPVQVPSVSADAMIMAEPCLPVTFFEEPKRHATHAAHAAHSHTVTDETNTWTTSSVSAGTHDQHDLHVHELPSATSFPRIGQGLWIMYEGGDPNYPVWVGVFANSFGA